MGARGPAPKPTALRILHGDRKDRINVDEPRPREGVPVAPTYLDDDERRVWRYTVEQLRPTRVLTKADRDALARYCVWCVQFERAKRLVQTTGVLMKGAKGGVVRNPAAQIMRDAGDAADRLAREFGLTPSSRSQIRVSPDVSEDEVLRLLS